MSSVEIISRLLRLLGATEIVDGSRTDTCKYTCSVSKLAMDFLREDLEWFHSIPKKEGQTVYTTICEALKEAYWKEIFENENH